MSKRQYSALMAVLVALLLVNAIGLVFHPMQVQYEYKILDIPDLEFQDTMRHQGDLGWDLVFARRAVGGDDKQPAYEVIFKRPTRAW